MKALFIIPARGGSKGIPRKNIKTLGGRPLIAYSIDVARNIAGDTELHRIVLSTDDAEIAACARALGLPVDYSRPAALGSDTTGSREVIIDVMDWADTRGIDYDCIVLLQPTSPFRTAGDVAGAMALYTSDSDMVVSVCESSANPYYNLFETDSEGCLHVCKGDNVDVYFINPDRLLSMVMGEFPRRIPYVMPRERSLDLDTPADWLAAEALIAAGATTCAG